MNDKKVGKVFSFIFGGITLVIVILIIALILFGTEIKMLLWDAFTHDEPQALFYDSENVEVSKQAL